MKRTGSAALALGCIAALCALICLLEGAYNRAFAPRIMLGGVTYTLSAELDALPEGCEDTGVRIDFGAARSALPLTEDNTGANLGWSWLGRPVCADPDKPGTVYLPCGDGKCRAFRAEG